MTLPPARGANNGRPLVVSSPHRPHDDGVSGHRGRGGGVMVAASSIGVGSAAEASACLPVLKGQVAPVPGTFQPGGRCPSCDGGKPVAVGTTASADGSFCPTAEGPGPPPPTPAPPSACGAQPEAMFTWTVGGQCLDADPTICSSCQLAMAAATSSAWVPRATAFRGTARRGWLRRCADHDRRPDSTQHAVVRGGGGRDKSVVVLLEMAGPQTVTEMVYAPGPRHHLRAVAAPARPRTAALMVDGSCHRGRHGRLQWPTRSPPTCSYNGTVTDKRSTCGAYGQARGAPARRHKVQ